MNDIGRSLPRFSAHALAGLLMAFTGHLHAQHSDEPMPATHIPTLERVQALLPEKVALDLDRFKNPIAVEPNDFDKVYDPDISPEEMALQHGGYINYGLNLGLYKSWQGIKKATGMRAETQSVIARPPPLGEEQMRRAAMVCGMGENDCPVGN